MRPSQSGPRAKSIAHPRNKRTEDYCWPFQLLKLTQFIAWNKKCSIAVMHG